MDSIFKKKKICIYQIEHTSRLKIWTFSQLYNVPSIMCPVVSFFIQFIGCIGSHWKQFIEYSCRNVGVTVDGAGHVNYIWNYDFGLQARGKFNYRLIYTVTIHSWQSSKWTWGKKKLNCGQEKKYKSSSGNEVFSKMSTLNIHPHSVSVKVFGELNKSMVSTSTCELATILLISIMENSHCAFTYTSAAAVVAATTTTTTTIKNVWMEKFLLAKPKSRLVSFCFNLSYESRTGMVRIHLLKPQ